MSIPESRVVHRYKYQNCWNSLASITAKLNWNYSSQWLNCYSFKTQITVFHCPWPKCTVYNIFAVHCSGLVVVGTAMTIYLGTLRPLLPNSCFQPSLSLHSIVQTCIRSPTWIWGRYLLEKLTPLNLFPVKNQESFFNYAALECSIFYQTEQTIF